MNKTIEVNITSESTPILQCHKQLTEARAVIAELCEALDSAMEMAQQWVDEGEDLCSPRLHKERWSILSNNRKALARGREALK